MFNKIRYNVFMSEKYPRLDGCSTGGAEKNEDDGELSFDSNDLNNNGLEEGYSVSLAQRHEAMKEIIPALNRISRDRGALEHASTEYGFSDFVAQYGSAEQANAKLNDMHNDISTQKHKISPELDKLMGDRAKFEELFPSISYDDERMKLAKEINDSLGYKYSDSKERKKFLEKTKPWWMKKRAEVADKLTKRDKTFQRVDDAHNDLPTSTGDQAVSSSWNRQRTPEEIQRIQIGTSEDAIDNYRQGHRGCSYEGACIALGYNVNPEKRFPIHEATNNRQKSIEEWQNPTDAEKVEAVINGFRRNHSEEEYKNVCRLLKVDFEKIKHLLNIKQQN